MFYSVMFGLRFVSGLNYCVRLVYLENWYMYSAKQGSTYSSWEYEREREREREGELVIAN